MRLRRMKAATFSQCARISWVRSPVLVRAAAMRARAAAVWLGVAPPCMRQRPFFMAGPLQGQPERVLAPHGSSPWAGSAGCGVGVASVVAVAEGAEAFWTTVYVHGTFLIQRRVERQGKCYRVKRTTPWAGRGIRTQRNVEVSHRARDGARTPSRKRLILPHE